MPFQRLLSELVDRVPGASGAILADWEGEAVAQSGQMDDYELKVIGAHKGVILSNLRDVVQRLDGDEPEEIIVTSGQMQTLILPITLEYFLVLTLHKGASLGMARFEARRCAARLRAEIA
jgi:predicted regulator of Ras-like GTPase activity (Roadblock/LC7/MglB family)